MKFHEEKNQEESEWWGNQSKETARADPLHRHGSHQERPEKLRVQNQQTQRTGDAKDHQGLSLNKSLQNIWKLGSSSSHFTR